MATTNRIIRLSENTQSPTEGATPHINDAALTREETPSMPDGPCLYYPSEGRMQLLPLQGRTR